MNHGPAILPAQAVWCIHGGIIIIIHQARGRQTVQHGNNKSSAVSEMGDRGHNRHGHLSQSWDTRLVQCGLGRGLLLYQAASSSIQPFGHSRHGPKIGWGGCALIPGVAGFTSNTMSRTPRAAFVPSGVLIRAAVWPQ